MSPEPWPAGRMRRRGPLGGIMVALGTPLDEAGGLDVAGLERLVEHVLSGGLHGIVVLGSTGEGGRLPRPIRRELLERTAALIAGRARLLVGVLRSDPQEVWDELEAAEAHAADGVLVCPPSLGPLDERGVRAFFEACARRTRLPVLLYNIPGFSHVHVSADTVVGLARDGVIAGVKDSSRDFEFFAKILVGTRGREDFAALNGTPSLVLPSLLLGAAGAITMTPNLDPNVEVTLWWAVEQGRWTAALDAHERLVRLVDVLRLGVFPAGVKAALALMGLCAEWTAFPAMSLGEDDRWRLASSLRELGYLGAEDGG